MTGARLTGQFIAGPKGPIFVLLREPPDASRGCVIVVPPFAEEMNKCRRMVTEVAVGLANSGISTIVPDLYGTGDSAGDFEDADWGTWVGDLGAVTRWADANALAPTGCLAIRLGAALALAASRAGQLPAVSRTALWQPVFDGGRYLQQFLRLRTVVAMMEDRRETLADLKAQLAGGSAVEVAGYSLSSRLAAELERLGPPEPWPDVWGRVTWIEVVRVEGAALPEPAQELLATARGGGAQVESSTVVGEPYWSATEIVVNAEVVSRTIRHLQAAERAWA